MKSTEKRFTGKFGDDYDLFKLASPHYDELQDSVRQLIVEEFFASPLEQINILEIGFGNGLTSKAILESDSRIHLIGVDNEELMLEKTTKTLGKFDKSRFGLIKADALEFLKSQADESFDGVASAFTIHNFIKDYRSLFLGELYRVLKLDGIFINADKIADSNPTEHERNRQWQNDQFNVFDKIGRPELKKLWIEHYAEDDMPDRILVENEFFDQLKTLGFSSCELINRWHDDAIAKIIK